MNRSRIGLLAAGLLAASSAAHPACAQEVFRIDIAELIGRLEAEFPALFHDRSFVPAAPARAVATQAARPAPAVHGAAGVAATPAVPLRGHYGVVDYHGTYFRDAEEPGSDATPPPASHPATQFIPAMVASTTVHPGAIVPVVGPQLLPADVGAIISRVVQEANRCGTPATIAVVDRLGAVLAVYQTAAAKMTMLPIAPNPHGANVQLSGFGMVPTTAEAISKAITGAYLSSSYGNAFSTRTASQIVQDHFDPGTLYAPSGPLYGVQFSSLPCSDLVVRDDPADPTSLTRGPHRSPLGLAADPGGFPLYKGGQLVGGIGVKAVGPYGDDPDIHDVDTNIDEILAIAGTTGLDAPAGIRADQIAAGGLLLRYSDVSAANLLTNPATAPPFASLPAGLVTVPGYYNMAAGLGTGGAYGSASSGLVADESGTFNAATPPYLLVNSNGLPRYPAIAGIGPGALTAAEVHTLLQNAYAVALQTRAQIRNPAGTMHAAVTISVVDVYGDILGVVTVADAPVFGIDVSLQKARTAAFLSNPNADAALRTDPTLAPYANAANADFGRTVFASGYAWSARSTGNIARDTLPDGIDGSPNGPLSLPASLTTPFSDGLQLQLVIGNLGTHVGFVQGANADTPPMCTALPKVGMTPAHPVLANGLQVFPGGFPIYRGSTLIGGIGVSGDGVDQDDLISFLGLYNGGAALNTGVGEAPLAMRSSQIAADGVQPHYVNCPYAPFLNNGSQNVCAGK